MQIADLFAVDIDLDTNRFVKAKLDDEVLTAKEAVILLWYNTVAAQHVKREYVLLCSRCLSIDISLTSLSIHTVHSTANWGLNLDDSLAPVNPFLRRNSVVTVMVTSCRMGIHCNMMVIVLTYNILLYYSTTSLVTRVSMVL